MVDTGEVVELDTLGEPGLVGDQTALLGLRFQGHVNVEASRARRDTADSCWRVGQTMETVLQDCLKDGHSLQKKSQRINTYHNAFLKNTVKISLNCSNGKLTIV